MKPYSTITRFTYGPRRSWRHRQLEIKSQAIVRALIYGDEISLDMEQIRTLAFWLAKTFMMLLHVNVYCRSA